MSAVETGQMSVVETTQMSSAETRQMSTTVLRQGAALSSYYTSVLSQQQTSVLSRQQTSLLLHEQTSVLSKHIVLRPQRGLNCLNITMLKSQKSQLSQYHNVQVSDSRSGPKSSKMTRNGSRMVART